MCPLCSHPQPSTRQQPVGVLAGGDPKQLLSAPLDSVAATKAEEIKKVLQFLLAAIYSPSDTSKMRVPAREPLETAATYSTAVLRANQLTLDGFCWRCRPSVLEQPPKSNSGSVRRSLWIPVVHGIIDVGTYQVD